MTADDAHVTIRRATAADAQAVKAVQEASIRSGAVEYYTPEALEAWVGAFSLENFPKRVEELSYWVAELPDGRITGYLSVNLETSEVDSVYVAPWGQGMRIGGRLLSFAEELAREAGLQRVWLDASLNAVRFYEKHGWQVVERHARVRHGVEIPVVKMEKELG